MDYADACATLKNFLQSKRRRGDNNFNNAINSISEADITK